LKNKEMSNSSDRVGMEIYDLNKGDGQVVIVFSDRHVVLFPAPNHELNKEEIKTILSVKGEDSLFGQIGVVP